MKVLLIYPPSFHMIRTNVPDVVDEETGKYPPLGVMYVAAGVRQFTNWDVEILDSQLDELSYQTIEAQIRMRKPDVVGIETLTFSLIDAYKTAALVKKIDPAIRVVMGGPHVYLYPDETVTLDAVDFLCLGEAEYSFPKLLTTLEEDGPLEDVPGLVYKHEGQILKNPVPPLIHDLDTLPFPARDLVPYTKYYSVLAKGSYLTTMMTSRGCPARCIFCDRPHLGKTFRFRSAMNVVDEMEACVNQFGIREFFLYDDTFSINKERVLTVCSEILRRKLDILWDIRARVNTVDAEVLTALRRAGCARIHYGIEAGTPEILKVLKKGITLEQVQEAFRVTKKAGIESLGYFMIGNPTETREHILETIRLSKSLGADYIHVAVTTPFPGTELYRMGLEQGMFTHDYWQAFAANPSEDFTPELWEKHVSRDELVELLMFAYKSFYGRPTYWVQRLVRIRSLPELRRKVKAAFNLLLR